MRVNVAIRKEKYDLITLGMNSFGFMLAAGESITGVEFATRIANTYGISKVHGDLRTKSMYDIIYNNVHTVERAPNGIFTVIVDWKS